MNNERQIGLALNMFFQDNENVFPYGIGPETDNNGRWPYMYGLGGGFGVGGAGTYWVHYLAQYYVSGGDAKDNPQAWLDPGRSLSNEGPWGSGNYRVMGQADILFRDWRLSRPNFPADLVLQPSKVAYMYCFSSLTFSDGVGHDGIDSYAIHPGGSDTYAFVDGHAETAEAEPLLNWFRSRGVSAFTYPPKAGWRPWSSQNAADKADWWVWPWYPGPRPRGLNGCYAGC